MEIHLTPEQEAELTRIASRMGKDAESLAQHAIDQLLKEEARFNEAVSRGFASLDRGEYVDHEEVRARLDRLLHS